jgi:hypothetical protein
MFCFVATLPSDRRLAGEYRLFNAAGNVVHAGACLGKADNLRAAQEGNPSRDPIEPYGDTPLGGYVPAKVSRFDPPHHRMGAVAIPLEGADGDALQARVRGKRAGLFIHAGRGDGRLVPTFGCLRLRDQDMAAVARIIGDDLVEVIVEGEQP